MGGKMNINSLEVWMLDGLDVDDFDNLEVDEQAIPLDPLPQSQAQSVIRFDEFPQSVRGLLGRLYLPNNQLATPTNISDIYFTVIDKETNAVLDSGILNPNDVLLATPVGKGAWPKDSIGFNFIWMCDSWQEAGKTYRIIVYFLTTIENVVHRIIRIWNVTTQEPSTA
jgi:hypothetical protein